VKSKARAHALLADALALVTEQKNRLEKWISGALGEATSEHDQEQCTGSKTEIDRHYQKQNGNRRRSSCRKKNLSTKTSYQAILETAGTENTSLNPSTVRCGKINKGKNQQSKNNAKISFFIEILNKIVTDSQWSPSSITYLIIGTRSYSWHITLNLTNRNKR
jgi:hypothetical protein